MNAHGSARATSGSMFSVLDFLKGTNTSDIIKGGSSAGYDFDFGVSIRPHWNLFGFEYEIGGAVNNVLGGKYDNVKKPLVNDWNRQDIW